MWNLTRSQNGAFDASPTYVAVSDAISELVFRGSFSGRTRLVAPRVALGLGRRGRLGHAGILRVNRLVPRRVGR